MSVFTPLERGELEVFLEPYGLGRLLDFQGIAAGSENSNFFVSLERGEFVLTLIERGPSADLPFFIELLDVLHAAELPVPYALRTRGGEALRELAGKPALLQPRLAGKHIGQPNAHHCSEVGTLLARLHLATREQVLERQSDRGLDWMLREGPTLALQLPEAELPLLRDTLLEIAALKPRILKLPRANLHADLFRDNVLFDGPHLAGLIDFYNACAGPMLYDLAIALNDWCSGDDGRLDGTRARALLGAYATLRPFTTAEAELWPAMLRIACVRFWLSRLIAADSFAGQQVLIHDPAEFQRRLSQRQQVDLHLPLAL
ncbi:MAG: homoserine kinase [Pseudomonadota bacterium]